MFKDGFDYNLPSTWTVICHTRSLAELLYITVVLEEWSTGRKAGGSPTQVLGEELMRARSGEPETFS